MLKDFMKAEQRLAELEILEEVGFIDRINNFLNEFLWMSVFVCLIYACIFQLTNEVMYVN